MSAYDWIKVGAICKWNIPDLDDYDDNEHEEILSRKFRIMECNEELLTKELNSNTEIWIDEIDGPSYCQVSLSEIEPYYDRYACEIDWVIDSEDDEFDDNSIKLPDVVAIPFYVDDYDIAEYLSDEYGFLINGYIIERVCHE